MIDEAVRTTIYKARINKKYPFKNMSLGETFKLSDVDVRGAQKLAYYYRSLCSAQFRLLSLNRMTAIIVAALLE